MAAAPGLELALSMSQGSSKALRCCLQMVLPLELYVAAASSVCWDSAHCKG